MIVNEGSNIQYVSDDEFRMKVREERYEHDAFRRKARDELKDSETYGHVGHGKCDEVGCILYTSVLDVIKRYTSRRYKEIWIR